MQVELCPRWLPFNDLIADSQAQLPVHHSLKRQMFNRILTKTGLILPSLHGLKSVAHAFDHYPLAVLFHALLLATSVAEQTERLLTPPPSSKADAKASRKKSTSTAPSSKRADKDESDSDEDGKRNRDWLVDTDATDQFRRIPKSRQTTVETSTAAVVEKSLEALPEARATELIANWHDFQVHRNENKSANAAREQVLLSVSVGAISSVSSSTANQRFSDMLCKIASEDLETVKFTEDIVSPYIDGTLTGTESQLAVDDLLAKVETAVVTTLRRSPFFKLTIDSHTATVLDTHDTLLKISRQIHTDDVYAAKADKALHHLMKGMAPSLLLEYLAKMRDIPKITGVFTGGQLWNAYDHWRETKFPGFEMTAILAAEQKKRAEIIAKTEYAFVPRSMARVRILIFSGERLVCEKTIPLAAMKKLGWHRHAKWIKRPADEWYWRYRVGTSEGDDRYIFKVQMNGKVIGLWSPDGDIDWDTEYDELLLKRGGPEIDPKDSLRLPLP
ncbi:hypothetical protein BKA65DRAFT_505903 [Rhexocercosporidium sp. MPI-PUGE-AT-0058]|nr:hypothetical protein BKA65DRAFT_505903 [Rhexocercosporidium sp. MPI-PUGE-AT-0058]